MKRLDFYTDMADECAEKHGMQNTCAAVTRKVGENLTVTLIKIKNEEEAKKLLREKGVYVTVECDGGIQQKEVRAELKKEIKNALRNMVAERLKGRPRVLVVGLGNRNVTADALGSLVVDNVIVTRNAAEEGYGGRDKAISVSGLAPGVFGATGIESLDIVKGVADKIAATLIIVIDTLATSRAGRLFNSFQLTDAGLQPGSATGSPRPKINFKSVGIPVIAVGVPMAIYARSLVYDTLEKTVKVRPSDNAKYIAADSVLGRKNLSLLLTPKEVDEGVKYCAEVIADGINLCFHNVTK